MPRGTRKATNATEPLNCAIRKAIKKRKTSQTDGSVKKLLFIATQGASKK